MSALGQQRTSAGDIINAAAQEMPAPQPPRQHLEILRDTQEQDAGGEGGIRTPDTLASMPHFECGAFNHSATSPEAKRA